jgi:hypothetical protein
MFSWKKEYEKFLAKNWKKIFMGPEEKILNQELVEIGFEAGFKRATYLMVNRKEADGG